MVQRVSLGLLLVVAAACGTPAPPPREPVEVAPIATTHPPPTCPPEQVPLCVSSGCSGCPCVGWRCVDRECQTNEDCGPGLECGWRGVGGYRVCTLEGRDRPASTGGPPACPSGQRPLCASAVCSSCPCPSWRCVPDACERDADCGLGLVCHCPAADGVQARCPPGVTDEQCRCPRRTCGPGHPVARP
ncbi:MAG: hypothetical protein IT384_01520 [Deltaproteobacteria bacterium]|nr:hypothetical protein [Deltaproteobacteria bacterium]